LVSDTEASCRGQVWLHHLAWLVKGASIRRIVSHRAAPKGPPRSAAPGWSKEPLAPDVSCPPHSSRLVDAFCMSRSQVRAGTYFRVKQGHAFKGTRFTLVSAPRQHCPRLAVRGPQLLHAVNQGRCAALLVSVAPKVPTANTSSKLSLCLHDCHSESCPSSVTHSASPSPAAIPVR
jgi:hypothetical protein